MPELGQEQGLKSPIRALGAGGALGRLGVATVAFWFSETGRRVGDHPSLL